MTIVATSPKPVSSMAGRERAELILGHLDRLPTLPTSVARLLAVTASHQSSARDVVEIIETDPVLTAGILRLARRADLGAPADTVTVARAVSLLGFRAVRNAVLSAQFFSVFPTGDREAAPMDNRREIWRHCLAVACLAEAIARAARLPATPAEAFVCGLLHDVGKIALDACLPKSYRRVLDDARSRGRCITEAEHALFGLDHTVAGKRLTSRWGLPEAVVECAWLHHQPGGALPSTVSARQLIRVVHLADGLTRANGIGYSGYAGPVDVAAAAGELGLANEKLASITESLPERIAPLLELIGLDKGDDPDLEGSPTLEQQLRRFNADLCEKNDQLMTRSIWFTAIERFVGQIGDVARLSDACAAAVEAVTLAFDVRGSLCWLTADRSSTVYVAGRLARSARPLVLALDRREIGLSPRNGEERTSSNQPGPASPTANGEIWRRVFGSPPTGPVQAVTITGARVRGALLLTSDGNDLSRRLAGDQHTAFAATIAMAASSAWGRMSAETMAEELVELNRKLQSAQKDLLRMRTLSMVTEMAAGAAHELNNPLAVISGRAQMEHARVKDPDQKQAFKTIVEQAQRASHIITDLMRFAKPEQPTPIVQPLAEVLDAVRQHWTANAPTIGNRLTVQLAGPNLHGHPDDTVYADAGQLMEMLNHVLANAVLAVEENEGTVTLQALPGVDDERVRLVVRDTGCGMTPEVLERAIDPFFSARKAGRGRGLGLSRAYRLAQINGGDLQIESTPNAGSSVVIDLPRRRSCADQD